jgi:hypothetical protein
MPRHAHQGRRPQRNHRKADPDHGHVRADGWCGRSAGGRRVHRTGPGAGQPRLAVRLLDRPVCPPEALTFCRRRRSRGLGPPAGLGQVRPAVASGVNTYGERRVLVRHHLAQVEISGAATRSLPWPPTGNHWGQAQVQSYQEPHPPQPQRRARQDRVMTTVARPAAVNPLGAGITMTASTRPDAPPRVPPGGAHGPRGRLRRQP